MLISEWGPDWRRYVVTVDCLLVLPCYVPECHQSWEQWPPGGTRLEVVLAAAGWELTTALTWQSPADLGLLGSSCAGRGASGGHSLCSCVASPGCLSTGALMEFLIFLSSGWLHLGLAGSPEASVLFTGDSATTGLASLGELLSSTEEFWTFLTLVFSGFASLDFASTSLHSIFPTIWGGFASGSGLVTDVLLSCCWPSTCFPDVEM